MNTRRDFLKTSMLGLGALAYQPCLAALPAAQKSNDVPKRFVFIRKGNGMMPGRFNLPTLDEKLKESEEPRVGVEPFEVALDKHELPEWLAELNDYKEHMTILQGLSAKMSENVHWSFSSVMGCFKSNCNTLSAIKRTTIDFELAKLFPSPFGHVELSFAGGRTGIV